MQREICFSVSGFREECNNCKSVLWARSYNICLLNVTCSMYVHMHVYACGCSREHMDVYIRTCVCVRVFM